MKTHRSMVFFVTILLVLLFGAAQAAVQGPAPSAAQAPGGHSLRLGSALPTRVISRTATTGQSLPPAISASGCGMTLQPGRKREITAWQPGSASPTATSPWT